MRAMPRSPAPSRQDRVRFLPAFLNGASDPSSVPPDGCAAGMSTISDCPLAALFASAVGTAKPRWPQRCRKRCEWHPVLAKQVSSRKIGWLLAFGDAMPANPFAEQLNWRRAPFARFGAYGLEPAKS